jgi:hypothetical protein
MSTVPSFDLFNLARLVIIYYHNGVSGLTRPRLTRNFLTMLSHVRIPVARNDPRDRRAKADWFDSYIVLVKLHRPAVQ